MPRRNQRKPNPAHSLEAVCSSKRRYNTEREALQTAEYQMLLNPELKLRVYKCPRCAGWHLTNQNNAIIE